MAKKILEPLVKINDHIFFIRGGDPHIGIVFKVQDNSVLVHISNESKEKLNYQTNKTVVSHKKYIILTERSVHLYKHLIS